MEIHGLLLDDNGGLHLENIPPYLRGETMAFSLIRLVCKVVSSVAESKWPPQQGIIDGAFRDTAEFEDLQRDFEI